MTKPVVMAGRAGARARRPASRRRSCRPSSSTHVSRWYGNVVAVNDVSFALGAGRHRPARAQRRRQVDPAAHDGRAAAPVGGPGPRSRGRPPGDDPAIYRDVGLVPGAGGGPPVPHGLRVRAAQRPPPGPARPDGAAARAIETVDLGEAADRPIGTYSKGMRQRAKIAGALVHDPPVLLLDEPFNGMDPRQRLHMMDLLRSMAAAGRTILFSSHILEEVERLADAILVILAGRLAASGDFRAIRRLMTDRPHTFTVRSSRRPAARRGAASRTRRCSGRS